MTCTWTCTCGTARLSLSPPAGAFSAYAARLRAGEGAGVPIRSTLLAASEGLMGVSLSDQSPPAVGGSGGSRDDGHAAYCLVPNAMFFEFLPAGADDTRGKGEAGRGSSGNGSSGGGSSGSGSGGSGGSGGDSAPSSSSVLGGTLLSHELTVGADYELVISNLGGLCRYRIGDVVKVVGFHKQSPLVEFQYRIGQLLNLRGEKLSEPQFERALGKALRSAHQPSAHQGQGTKGASITDGAGYPTGVPPALEGEYAVVEESEAEPPRYRVYYEPSGGVPTAGGGGGGQTIERPRAASEAAAAAYAARLDEALCEENPVYATWRRKRAIGASKVSIVPPGGFEALRSQRLVEGASPQQMKVSRVLRDPTHAALLSSWKGQAAGS